MYIVEVPVFVSVAISGDVQPWPMPGMAGLQRNPIALGVRVAVVARAPMRLSELEEVRLIVLAGKRW